MRWSWLVVLCLFALPARATTVRLDLGADDWLDQSTGVFEFTLAPMVHLARHVHVGVRFGALVTSSPVVAGVPVDIDLRFFVPHSSLYLEGLGGPWFLFQGTTVHGHGAFGFGLSNGEVSFGLEVGYLDPRAVIGARLGFVF
jgi:hypothetical protein